MASPASNGGRGLKPLGHGENAVVLHASPASNGGRGLKRSRSWASVAFAVASPASNGGRGLKLVGGYAYGPKCAHRPPAMAGAD